MRMDPNKKYRVAFEVEVTGDDTLAHFQNQDAAHFIAGRLLSVVRINVQRQGGDPDKVDVFVDPLLREGPHPGIASVFHRAYTWRPFGLFRPERPSEKVMRLLSEQEAARASD